MDENRLTADVLLAITDASTGAPVIDSAHLRPLLAGTAITELVLRGALTLTQGGRFGVGRVPMPVDARWTDVVQRALGRTPTSAITRVAGSAAWRDRTLALRAAAAEDLAVRGVARDASTWVFGILPRRRLEILRPDDRIRLLARVHEVLATDRGTRHDHAVASMLAAGGTLRTLFPQSNRRWIEHRGTGVTQGEWAGSGLRLTIREVLVAEAAAVWTAAASTVASA
ncbi:MAG: GPP34 family phosphoprotein [Phycicoccus sp.]|nr:GPP34 family phosphoprotein [Phycicoccus sp.]